MLSKFDKSIIRMSYFLDLNFDYLKKNKSFFKKFKESNFKTIEEFFAHNLGYREDDNFSSIKRLEKRKEVMENIDNGSYWRKQADELGVTRTSEVTEKFQYWGFLGLGLNSVTGKTNPYYNPQVQGFIKAAEPLVKIFCEATSNIKLLSIDKKSEDIYIIHLLSVLYSLRHEKKYKFNSYSEFMTKLRVLLKNYESSFKIVRTSEFAIRGNTIYVKGNTLSSYSDSFIISTLIYCATLRLDIIPLKFYPLYKLNGNLTTNLLILDDEQYLNLLDLCYMFNITGRDLLKISNMKIPDIDYMIENFNGVLCISNSGNVHYVPKSASNEYDNTCCFPIEDFVSIVNLNKLFGIYYVNSTPIIDNIPIGVI